jgi:hypothetical protein
MCAVAFVGGASGVLKHQWADSHDCLSWACIREYAISAVHAGGLATLAYLMRSPFAQTLAQQISQEKRS